MSLPFTNLKDHYSKIDINVEPKNILYEFFFRSKDAHRMKADHFLGQSLSCI